MEVAAGAAGHRRSTEAAQDLATASDEPPPDSRVTAPEARRTVMATRRYTNLALKLLTIQKTPYFCKRTEARLKIKVDLLEQSLTVF